MDHFDSYNALLAIATNTHMVLKTGFVLQGHIFNAHCESLSPIFGLGSYKVTA